MTVIRDVVVDVLRDVLSQPLDDPTGGLSIPAPVPVIVSFSNPNVRRNRWTGVYRATFDRAGGSLVRVEIEFADHKNTIRPGFQQNSIGNTATGTREIRARAGSTVQLRVRIEVRIDGKLYWSPWGVVEGTVPS